jgi:hypothetical protein
MRKSFLHLGLALALMAPLAACGDSGSPTDPDKPGATHMSFKSIGYYGYDFGAKKNVPAVMPDTPLEYAVAFQDKGMTIVVGVAPLPGRHWGVTLIGIQGTTKGSYRFDGAETALFTTAIFDEDGDELGWDFGWYEVAYLRRGTLGVASADSKRIRGTFDGSGEVERYDLDGDYVSTAGTFTLLNGSFDVPIRNDLLDGPDGFFSKSPAETAALRAVQKVLPALQLR